MIKCPHCRQEIHAELKRWAIDGFVITISKVVPEPVDPQSYGRPLDPLFVQQIGRGERPAGAGLTAIEPKPPIVTEIEPLDAETFGRVDFVQSEIDPSRMGIIEISEGFEEEHPDIMQKIIQDDMIVKDRRRNEYGEYQIKGISNHFDSGWQKGTIIPKYVIEIDGNTGAYKIVRRK